VKPVSKRRSVTVLAVCNALRYGFERAAAALPGRRLFAALPDFAATLCTTSLSSIEPS
jgi:hypothetical protein